MKFVLDIFMSAFAHLTKRGRHIIASDYGRDGGWYVEQNGRRIAILSDPQYEDMFWVSYTIEPLTEDEEERRQILESEEFWLTEFVYRSKQFGEIADNAFPALKPFASPGRITMRGLYLTPLSSNSISKSKVI